MRFTSRIRRIERAMEGKSNEPHFFSWGTSWTEEEQKQAVRDNPDAGVYFKANPLYMPLPPPEELRED